MRRARKSSMLHTMRGGKQTVTLNTIGSAPWLHGAWDVEWVQSHQYEWACLWSGTRQISESRQIRTGRRQQPEQLLHTYWKLWIEKPRNMKAASIVNEAYFVEQWKRLRKQLKPIDLWFNDFSAPQSAATHWGRLPLRCSRASCRESFLAKYYRLMLKQRSR